MQSFLEIHPLDRIIEKLDINVFSADEKKVLGSDILDFLNTYGIASFGDGFIQTIHPLKTQYLLDGWIIPKKKCYPFLKTSFGIVYFKFDDSIGYIDPIYKEIETKIANLKVVLNIFFCNQEILKNAYFKDIHDKVYPRLGILENDEIYSFVPALALGGSRNPENVEKVKAREQLIFLSQL